jgi:hypothetical protein
MGQAEDSWNSLGTRFQKLGGLEAALVLACSVQIVFSGFAA